jgi:hypothetical protein
MVFDLEVEMMFVVVVPTCRTMGAVVALNGPRRV